MADQERPLRDGIDSYSEVHRDRSSTVATPPTTYPVDSYYTVGRYSSETTDSAWRHMPNKRGAEEQINSLTYDPDAAGEEAPTGTWQKADEVRHPMPATSALRASIFLPALAT